MNSAILLELDLLVCGRIVEKGNHYCLGTDSSKASQTHPIFFLLKCSESCALSLDTTPCMHTTKKKIIYPFKIHTSTPPETVKAGIEHLNVGL